MRAAFIVSAALHLTILLAAVVSLPSVEPFATAAVTSLPVELVTIDEETDVTEGDPNETEVVEEAAPETVEVETPPEPTETPGATDTPAEEIATDEDARENAPESAAPEPAGEPEPPQETAEAPEPEATPETEVAALEPQETPPPSESAAEPVRVPETTVPRRRPPPPPRRQARVERPSEDAFNADRLSQLINRTDPSGGGAGSAQASLGAQTGRAAAALTLSEKDALRSQMQQCWSPPIGLAGGEALVVTVQIRLAPDGAVEAIDDVGGAGGTLYQSAADAARRAVLQCQPYRLPVAKYDAWKDIQVNFDPRDLF
ncbi:MAG: cell envelope biogenesis protein TolA [Pseudomonadota bacterium]